MAKRKPAGQGPTDAADEQPLDREEMVGMFTSMRDEILKSMESSFASVESKFSAGVGARPERLEAESSR